MSIDPAAQFDAVRLLIKQNKFDRARTILEGMEGKKAQRWLDELNERHPPTPVAAAKPITIPSPVESSGPSLDKIDLEKARAYMRDGKYKEARSLLIANDDPAAGVLLQRLNDMDRSKQSPSVQVMPVLGWGWGMTLDAPSSFYSRILMVIVFLCLGVIPGLIVLPGFVAEAKRYPEVPGANILLMLNKLIFYILLGIMLLFILVAVLTVIQVNRR